MSKPSSVKGLWSGEDFGIISYNETPVKEVQCGGISILSLTSRNQAWPSLVGIRTVACPCELIIWMSIRVAS
ncbi:MAG: hypothetical protein KBS80_09085 [Bacteroidales bacterium]|nr:hypothetical protein [Candidatus Cryptobacteroides choladohippi]